MASLQSPPFFLGISFLFLLLLSSPAHSLNCASQQNVTDNNNNLFINCTDLPSLNSSLHHTYNAANSSLSVAFIAPPVNSDGWIAWGINPTGEGMIGTQSLIAFKQANGSMTVKTYNISSYRSVEESKLSFGVSHLRGEYSGKLMKIFATLALSGNVTEVNHVWQVGSSVTDGVPDKHDFLPANLNAKGKLEIMKVLKNGTAGSNTNVTSNSSSSSGLGPSAAISGGNSVIGDRSTGVYISLLFLANLAFLLSSFYQ